MRKFTKYPSNYVKASGEVDTEFESAVDEFTDELELFPEILNNPFQTPIYFSNNELTIIANPNFEDIDDYIKRVEELGVEYGVLKPNTGYYDRNDHKLHFELRRNRIL